MSEYFKVDSQDIHHIRRTTQYIPFEPVSGCIYHLKFNLHVLHVQTNVRSEEDGWNSVSADEFVNGRVCLLCKYGDVARHDCV